MSRLSEVLIKQKIIYLILNKSISTLFVSTDFFFLQFNCLHFINILSTFLQFVKISSYICNTKHQA